MVIGALEDNTAEVPMGAPVRGGQVSEGVNEGREGGGPRYPGGTSVCLWF